MFVARTFARYLLLGLSVAHGLWAQGQLGPAPLAPQSKALDHEARSAAPAGTWYDTSSRENITDAYKRDYAPTTNVPTGWVGNVEAGVEGTTSTAYKNAVISRVNWFRAMAGIPAGIALDDGFSAKAQKGALMIRANNGLSHYPPTSWRFYTADGASALANSNIGFVLAGDTGGVQSYMEDFGAGNETVGHREWLLHPPLQRMGTGDIIAGPILWNALWVNDGNYFTPRPQTRDRFVGWPPKGYVPYPLLFPRWSFKLDGANLAAAEVSVKRNGVDVPLRFDSRTGTQLVWILDNQDPNAFFSPGAPLQDVLYSVTVANVRVNGVAENIAYNVISFDPESARAAQCTYNVSSAATVGAGATAAMPVTLVAQGSNCSWTASSAVSWAQVYPLSGNGSATLDLALSPNFSTRPRDAALSVAGQQLTITQQAGTGTEDERFVRQLYFYFFGREPSPADLAFQVSQGLTAGRANLALRFLQSEEFNQGGRFVAGLYVGLLDRDAEFGGWLFQRNALLRGATTPEQIVDSFLKSPEYSLRFGAPDDRTFVQLLYRQILLREPTAAETAFQTEGVQSSGRIRIASNFLNSEEFRIGAGPRLTAFLVSATLLNRDPTPAEKSTRIASLIGNRGNLAPIIAGVLNSAEYRALLQ